MIKFFEFMNTCSPSRTVLYLLFITIITYISFVGLVGLVRTIRGCNDEHYNEIDE